MNEFDQFVKHRLKIKHYARYTDDFVIVSNNRAYMEELIIPIQEFLQNRLKLKLHPGKIEIRKFSQGVDFLGYVLLPHHKILRAKTRRRMFRKLKAKIADYKNGKTGGENLKATLLSYSGIVSHCNGHKLNQELKNYYWFKKA